MKEGGGVSPVQSTFVGHSEEATVPRGERTGTNYNVVSKGDRGGLNSLVEVTVSLRELASFPESCHVKAKASQESET